jgi:hypothetical protein
VTSLLETERDSIHNILTTITRNLMNDYSNALAHKETQGFVPTVWQHHLAEPVDRMLLI